MEKITKLPLLDETGKKIVQELNDLKAYTAAYMDGSDGMFLSFIMDGPPEELSNNNIKNVRSYAFYSRFNLTAIDLPNAISIGNGAFVNCSALATVNLPKVTSIGWHAFKNCSSLTTIDTSNLMEISNAAFDGCSNLTSIILRNTEQVCTVKKTNSWDNTVIYNGTGYIYVPDELVEQYKAATYWSNCSDKIKPLSEYVESEAQL